MSKTLRISIAVLMMIVLWCGGGVIAYTAINGSNEVVSAATAEQTREIQQKLKDLGYFKTDVTGYYGPITTEAVKKFQYDYGLPVTGQADRETLNRLGINAGYQTNNDLYLLAKCVYAEARGEPYVGQVAVAAVILNRVKNSDFPNTIYGVIYQPWAFTAVADGQINLEPNNTAYQAAQDALNGWDPSYGCIYYFNPVTATSKWIWSRQQVVTIGKHIFAI